MRTRRTPFLEIRQDGHKRKGDPLRGHAREFRSRGERGFITDLNGEEKLDLKRSQWMRGRGYFHVGRADVSSEAWLGTAKWGNLLRSQLRNCAHVCKHCYCIKYEARL
jgi:hypothetical protein